MVHLFVCRAVELVRPRRVAAVVAAVALVATGTALARAPSIHLSGPATVALSTTATFTASGYFTSSKAHPYTRPNIAEVVRLRGTVNPTTKECAKHGTYVAGGPAEKQWRAKTPTTPGHFSANFKVKGTKAGNFTLCALMGNYPAGGILRKPHTWLHYSVH